MTAHSDLLTLVEITAYDPSRSNLLSHSRDFAASAWTKAAATITANAATGHDGLVLADKLAEAASNAVHSAGQVLGNMTSGDTAWLSVMVKAAGRTKVRLETDGTAGTGAGDFDLSTGTVAAVSGIAAEASVIQYGGGWMRCAVRVVATGTGTVGLKVILSSGTYGAAYMGDGTSGVFLDRALVEVGAALGDFIDTTAAAGPGFKVLRYSNREFVTGAADIPPHVRFQPRIISTPNFTRRIFSDLRVMSGGIAGAGVLELANADHALAELLDLGLDGRDLKVWIGPADAAFPSGFTPWLTGTIDQVEVGMTKATLRLRDRLVVLDTQVQSVKYAGTNVGSTGIEGLPEDIGGKPKPICMGLCYQVPPVLVNAPLLIYQVHDGLVMEVFDVYDRGVPLTNPATNHATSAALAAATVAAGEFHTCRAEGLIRLGATPDGLVTADVEGSEVDGIPASSPVEMMRRILLTYIGISPSEIDASNFSALDDVTYANSGIYISEPVSARQVVDIICASAGFWVIPNRLGIWRVGRLEGPEGMGAADYTITDDNILDIDRIATADSGRGIPAARVNVRYRRHYAAFRDADLAPVSGSLTAERRAELLAEWRDASAESASVRAAHSLAAEIDRDTLRVDASEAAAEAARLLAMFGVRRDYVRLRIPLVEPFTQIEFGDVIEVVTPALGYAAGRLFTPVGITLEAQTIELDLWG